ncbi:MAG: hypothetical protein ACK4RK_15990 [Gemmataceae bacterium]
MSEEVAKALAQHQGTLLSFESLRFLSDGVAKALKQYRGKLELPIVEANASDNASFPFAIFRRHPVSQQYKKPMSRKSCSNYIGELGRFFHWLYLSKDWNWRKPEDYDAISRRPREVAQLFHRFLSIWNEPAGNKSDEGQHSQHLDKCLNHDHGDR